VSVLDLLNEGLLVADQELKMKYGPSGKNKKTYKATINNDGSLTVDESNFSSPSYAALYCIKDAGSNRDTVNGWTKWRTDNEELLSDIRSKYLEISETHNNDESNGGVNVS